jgi:hypothetical protein
MLGLEGSILRPENDSLQPGQIWDEALHRPSYEGLWGTVLCLECGFLGIGYDHPEWCSWEVLKARPSAREKALAITELGERVVGALEAERLKLLVRLSI